MRWFWFLLHRLLPVAIVAAITLGMRSWLTPWAAWTATTACGAGLATLGALVVRSTRVGERSWRNRLAGHLLPWGHRFGGGRLPGIVAGCVVTWAALAGGILLGTDAWCAAEPVARSSQAPAGTGTGPTPWLVLAWLVDGTGLLYLLGLLRKHYNPGSRVTRSQARVVGAVSAILLGSVALHFTGQDGLALLVAGGPPLLLGSGFTLFAATILLSGRNHRWN
jgi:hypothetical protein